MRSTSLLTVGLAALLSAATLPFAATADDLVDFRSDDGRFQIAFPHAAPQSRSMSAEKFRSTTDNFHHEVVVDEAEFSVERHDIPRIAALLLTENFILDRAKEGVLEDMGATEVETLDLTRQQHPARRVRYEIPSKGHSGELLLVLAERRLYLIGTQHPKQRKPPMTFSTFIESFEFWLE